MAFLKVSDFTRKVFFILSDFIIITLSTYLAYSLRFDFSIPSEYIFSLYLTVAFLVILRVAIFNYFRIYNISWRHFGFKDTTSLVYLTTLSTILFLLFSYILRGNSEFVVPRSIIPIEFFITLVSMLALRMSKRLYLESLKRNVDGKSTIIVANMDNANSILRTINSKKSNYYPVAVINNYQSDIKINGVEVYTLEKFLLQKIECEVAILDNSVKLSDYYKKFHEIGIKSVKVASDYSEYGASIKDISVSDLLARNPKDLDKTKISSFIKDKKVLITGAGGSIGSEIVRQCIAFGASELILVDNSEFNLYSIDDELEPTVKRSLVMQSVVDKRSLENTFSKYEPDIVIHAAAYKHVPLVEENISEAIENNIIGTKNMIDLSIEHNVEKFVLISTDKAVRPTNVMGTTKRICELYAQNVVSNSTEIVAVRFGNVLGSSGSVIPKFQAQIEAGKNITVTHPDITRYFMLIPEACELVLQAGAIGKGGEIFILDMGEPIKIVDLAQKMIDLSGRDDISIEFSGLRKGEKLYEELLIDESDAKTEYNSITVAKPTPYNIEKLSSDIKELLQTQKKLEKLKEIVPEFSHRLN
jgi:UDP-N-acetyl-D-glucosamine 4,6-dehydratase